MNSTEDGNIGAYDNSKTNNLFLIIGREGRSFVISGAGVISFAADWISQLSSFAQANTRALMRISLIARARLNLNVRFKPWRCFSSPLLLLNSHLQTSLNQNLIRNLSAWLKSIKNKIAASFYLFCSQHSELFLKLLALSVRRPGFSSQNFREKSLAEVFVLDWVSRVDKLTVNMKA